MSPGEVLRTNKGEGNRLPYMNMVGALRYAADCTRPDITFVTSLLARFLTNPGKEHYDAVATCMNNIDIITFPFL